MCSRILQTRGDGALGEHPSGSRDPGVARWRTRQHRPSCTCTPPSMRWPCLPPRPTWPPPRVTRARPTPQPRPLCCPPLCPAALWRRSGCAESRHRPAPAWGGMPANDGCSTWGQVGSPWRFHCAACAAAPWQHRLGRACRAAEQGPQSRVAARRRAPAKGVPNSVPAPHQPLAAHLKQGGDVQAGLKQFESIYAAVGAGRGRRGRARLQAGGGAGSGAGVSRGTVLRGQD